MSQGKQKIIKKKTHDFIDTDDNFIFYNTWIVM